MKNNISKITLISTLLVSNVAPAQNFHQCIPTNEWGKNRAKEAITDTHIQDEARKVIRDENWVRDIIKKEEDKKWTYVQTIEFDNIDTDNPLSKLAELSTGNVYKFVISDKSYILSIPFDAIIQKTTIAISLLNCSTYFCDTYVDSNFLGRVKILFHYLDQKENKRYFKLYVTIYKKI